MQVEKIIDEKYRKGNRYLLIRWKGYGMESDTWEPESTLSCPDLIKKFEASKSAAENGSAESAKDKSKKAKKKGDDEPKKKKKKLVVKPADWSETENFEVARILEVHHNKSGKREFLVSWKGYPTSSDSWEPEDNLDCPDLIKKFMEKVKDAKQFDVKELRANRVQTDRFTLQTKDSGRRLSRRLGTRQR